MKPNRNNQGALFDDDDIDRDPRRPLDKAQLVEFRRAVELEAEHLPPDEVGTVRDPRRWLATVDGTRQVAAELYRGRIKALYALLGAARADCRACGKPIWFVTSRQGRQIPMTDDGVSHFTDCPKADELRRRS